MCQGGRPTVSVVSRSAGRSATAAVAYRAAAKIEDLRTGDLHDYTKKQGVEDVIPFLPVVAEAGETLPPHLERLRHLESLWQDAEAAERRSNSRVARELLVPLPHELNREQRRELVEHIAGDIAARYGVAGTACIHLPDAKGDQRNHHAHILFTTRRVDLATGQLAEKTRELDGRKTGPQEIEALVAMAEQRINQALESAQLERRVDFRSLKDRHAEAVASGDQVKAAQLNYTPQTHEGPQVTAIRREAEQRRAHAWREGWTDADEPEAAPLSDFVLGECQTIEDNESAKADRAAALDEAAALWVVLDARAEFEAARIEADRARAAGELEEKAGQLSQLEQPEPAPEPPPSEPAAATAAVGQDWLDDWPEPANLFPVEPAEPRTTARLEPQTTGQSTGLIKAGASLGEKPEAAPFVPAEPAPEPPRVTVAEAQAIIRERERLRERWQNAEKGRATQRRDRDQLPEVPPQTVGGAIRDALRIFGASPHKQAQQARAAELARLDELDTRLADYERTTKQEQATLDGQLAAPEAAALVKAIDAYSRDQLRFGQRLKAAEDALKKEVLHLYRVGTYRSTAKPDAEAMLDAARAVKPLEQEVAQVREAVEAGQVPDDSAAVLRGFAPTAQQQATLDAVEQQAQQLAQVPEQLGETRRQERAEARATAALRPDQPRPRGPRMG